MVVAVFELDLNETLTFGSSRVLAVIVAVAFFTVVEDVQLVRAALVRDLYVCVSGGAEEGGVRC